MAQIYYFDVHSQNVIYSKDKELNKEFKKEIKDFIKNASFLQIVICCYDALDLLCTFINYGK